METNQILSKNITDFSFLGNNVRVVVREELPWFVLADVAKVLGIQNPSDMAVTLRESQKARFNLGIGSPAIVINESGLFRILLRSDKPNAEKFQIWVEDEVLPSIRKHGMYATPLTIDAMIANPDFAIDLLMKLKEERALREKAEKEKQVLLHSGKSYTATEIAKECNLSSATQLNKILAEKHIQYKQNKTWVLYSKYSMMGLTETKQTQLESGRVIYDRHFTGKGREFILNLLIEL